MMKVIWIVVDWGMLNLCVWFMDAVGIVLADLSSPKGMGSLASDVFELVLLDLVAAYLLDSVIFIIACGMVGVC